CLLMLNRPEYLAIWLGITRVGGVVALLNTNLAGLALAHCINAVGPKHIIVAADLLIRLQTATPHVIGDPRTWVHGDANAEFPRIDREIAVLPADRLAASEHCALTIEDRALYIYTSGTTGLPKAANVNHYRLMLASLGFAGVMDIHTPGGHTTGDRMY